MTSKEIKPQPDAPKSPELTPKQVVMRVLGCGQSAADGVLRRMGAAADQLPAKYASREARDWVAIHNIAAPKADPTTDAVESADGEAAGDVLQE